MARAATGKAKAGAGRPAKPRKPRGKKAQAEAARAERRRWAIWAAAVILGVLAVRLAVNAAALIPPHFDEAQYWAYGQELAWGYLSKPAGVGALIRASTDVLGDTLFALRLPSPLAHAGIAALLFLVATRIWDGRTGFWAAAGYTAAPGVTASAMIVSTDPPMMLGWAAALYAMLRAGEDGPRQRQLLWWAACGAAIGLAVHAKYTAVAFGVGALGYGLFSARERDLGGAALAVAVATLVVLPNILWNAEHSFATFAHVAEDADPGEGYLNPLAFLEFTGAQLGVIGPVFFAAILAALWWRGEWRAEWGMRLIAWQTFALLLPIAALAFATRAQPNWAAPAYLGGAILAARWLVTRDWRRALQAQLWTGGVAAVAVIGLAALYADRATELPRWADPFKKMRIGPEFCARALSVMDEMGAEVLLSDSRRRLSECMFLGGLGWDRVAVWNPDRLPDTHHELVATLQPGDRRPMVLAVLHGAQAAEIAARFEIAEEIEVDRFPTHADREMRYAIWYVEGFRGYDLRY